MRMYKTPLLIAKLAEADCIIVDGPPGRMPQRTRAPALLSSRLRRVFDDSQRDHNDQLIRKLRRDQGWQARGHQRRQGPRPS